MNIVPNSASEHWGINIFVHCHCIISKIVSNVKFLINQLSHIWIKAIYQRVTMVFPAIVLNTENRTNVNKMWPSIVLSLPLCRVVRLLMAVGIHCLSSTSLAPSFTYTPVWCFRFLYCNMQKAMFYNLASLKTRGISYRPLFLAFSLSASSLSPQRQPPRESSLLFHHCTHSNCPQVLFQHTSLILFPPIPFSVSQPYQLSLLVSFPTLNLTDSFLSNSYKT